MVKKGRILIKTGITSVRVKLLRSDKHGVYVFDQDLCSIEKGHFFRNPDHTCGDCTEMFPSGDSLDKHKKHDCPCR